MCGVHLERAFGPTSDFSQWHLKPSWFGAGRMLALSVLGLGAALTALAADPTSVPLLRLETGMHTAMIRRIATDAAGRYAVSASDDKTARVWELATGRLVQVLRPPQDVGDEGKLYAVALSPDGTTVAAAGWTDGTGPAGLDLPVRS